MEEFEYDGIFWDSQTPDLKLAGRVSFEPSTGAKLSILGSFTEVQAVVSDRTVFRSRIHGVANRTYLTLVSCHLIQHKIDSPGIAREEYHVHCVLSGAHFTSEDELKFDEVSVSYDQLAHWVRRSGFSIKFESPTPTLTTVSRIDVGYAVQPDEVEHQDDLELRLGFTWHTSGDQVTSFNLGQDTWISLKYSDLYDIDEILVDINGLQDLITLAVDAPTVPTEITLWRSGLMQESSHGEARPQAIGLFMANAAEQVRQEKPQAPHDMFFVFNDVGGLSTVGKWIAVSRKYRIALGSLLTIRYSARLYSENRFSNVVLAAETFHRLRFDNFIIPKDQFKSYRRKLVRTIRRTIGRDTSEWLMRQLLYSNEPRLRHRLIEMAEFAGEGFSSIVGDIQSWSAVIVLLRNRLTHHDKDQAFEQIRQDLPVLTDSTYILIMMCLFRECGVPADTLRNIENSMRIHYLKRNVADVIERYRPYLHGH